MSEPEDGQLGEVQFACGQIQHAAASGLEGIDALREMMRWTSPNFSVGKSAAEVAHSIDDRWARVFDKVQRSIPRAAAPRPSSTGSSRKRKSPAKKKAAVVRDGKKVLVIDDTDTLLDFVEQMLGTADPRLQILSAPDGTEGSKASLRPRPDLILLDSSLPDFNGDEVCAGSWPTRATTPPLPRHHDVRSRPRDGEARGPALKTWSTPWPSPSSPLPSSRW